jgi:hypothetical protein
MEDDTEIPGAAEPIPDSLLPYDQWMEEAMRGVVAQALSHVALEGLPGRHHFYITFRPTTQVWSYHRVFWRNIRRR